MLKLWLTFVFMALLVAVWVAQGLIFLQEAPTSTQLSKTIEVPNGASFAYISNRLYEENIITDPFYFRLLGRLTGQDKQVQSGEYLLHAAMRPMEVLERLVTGRIIRYSVTFREGLTASQIGKILEERQGVNRFQFEAVIKDSHLIQELGVSAESLEGYLFPDTYQLTIHGTADETVRVMVKQFWHVYNTSFQNRAAERGMTTHEVVTLASIIEKETASEAEQPLVSAVFNNRLKQGMRLQSDPTVSFGSPYFNGTITKADLAYPSPYNTYRISGLPPGPIANPGKAALYAALHPADVDYLYFVSKDGRTHQFSTTLDEHNQAVCLYQNRCMNLTKKNKGK